MNLKRVLLIILAVLVCSVTELKTAQLNINHLTGDADFKLSTYEMQQFKKHLNDRLPNYLEHFKKYANKYQVPWVLLAAVAYQESKWNNKAVSYTGVKGLMQITEQTALHIGLSDREDAVQSIRGGAYYLKYLFNKTSPELTETQRWIHTLTAYNLGWGGFRDAYRLSLHLKKNPYEWEDFKFVLSDLQNEEHINRMRYGPARGAEAVKFIENVFGYYVLINQSLGRNFLLASL